MKRLTQTGSMARVVAIAFACLLGLAATAHANDSMTVTFGPDPTEEVPVPITMRWASAYPNPLAIVTIKRSGGLNCGATYSIDDPNSDNVLVWRGGFTGARTRNLPFSDQGSWFLCGYLQRFANDPAPLAVTGPVTLAARAARATVAIGVPERVNPGQAFTLSVSVTAELPRYVVVTRKPAVPGAVCATPYAVEDPISLAVLSARVQGTMWPARVIAAPRVPGTYLLCAYVLEGRNGNPAPEAVASKTYVVGPDPCVTAKAALATAAQAVATANSSVRRYHRSYTRQRNRARHAHGERRVRLRRLAARQGSRYRSALDLRDKARATLVVAQQNVTTACPSV